MEILDSRSPEVRSFFQSMDEMQETITVAMCERTLHLNSEKYLSRDDVCQMIHISARTLQDYRDSGRLGYVKISDKIIIYKQSDIMKLLEDNYYAADPRFHFGK